MDEPKPNRKLEMCENRDCGEMYGIDPGSGEPAVCPHCGTPAGQKAPPSAAPATPNASPPAPAGNPPPATRDGTSRAQPIDAVGPEATCPPPTAQAADEEQDKPIDLADDLDETPAPPRRPERDKTPSRASRTKPGDERVVHPPAMSESVDNGPSLDETADWLDDEGTRGENGPLIRIDELELPPAELTESSGDRVLQSPLATGAVLCSGVLGLLGGAWIGVVSMPSAMVLGAYLGAAGGWLAGFLMGFLMTLAIDRSEGDDVRCPQCRTYCPAEAETCRWCGASLGRHLLGPVTAECLASASYAVGNVPALLWLGMLMLLAGLAVGGAIEVARLEQISGSWGPLLWAAAAVVAAWVVSYAFEYVLDAISAAVAGARTPPDAPRLASLRQPAAGAYLVGLVVAYVLPVVTLPLLPIALVRLGLPGRAGVFRVRSLARAAWREVRDFEIVWLFLLMWALAGALGALLIAQGLTLLARSIPVESETTRVAVRALWIGLASGIGGLVGGVPILSMACCIGALGRCRRPSFAPSPVGRSEGRPGDAATD